ncbi:hypothetical protein EDB95_2724 [Dinghuibacter silviterrae]|uniref:PH (Pleckstrin Homology) domain-containing protein n=2 Tax=Dinghuibacter silviterrae TaxID=1539049 RepID=A0A4R8DTN5_9BACT|nr:hypothetical protein EDB95_2724 [Dinghuibacter silviterrae]
MPQDTPIEIARNKKNLAWYLAGGLLFFAIGLFLLIDPGSFLDSKWITPFIIEAVGVSIMVAGGIYSYIMAVRIATVFPAMIISDKDIYDHTGTPGDGLINWDDISGIRESEIKGKRYLTIDVKHPQLYIDRQRNTGKRKVLVRLLEQTGSPIQIPAHEVDYDLRSLITLLETRLAAYRLTGAR